MKISVSKSRASGDWNHCDFSVVEPTTAKEFAKIIVADHWSGIIWQNGKRSKANYLECGLAVLDFDDGAMTIEKAGQRCDELGLFHVIGTTKSHRRDKHGLVCDRFRLVLRFGSAIQDCATYEHNMKILARFFHSDWQATNGGMKFAPCGRILMAKGGGDLAIEKAPPPKKIWQTRHNILCYSGRTLPDWVNNYLINGIPSGMRNNTLFRVCKKMQESKFSEDETLAKILGSNIDLDKREIRSVVSSAYRN